MKNMKEKFSKIISEKLEGENISALAKKLGLPPSLLHDWARSRRLPSMKNIHHVLILSEYLNMSLEEIFFGETKKNKILSSVSFDDEDRTYRILIERLK